MSDTYFIGLTRFSVDPRSIINRQKRTLNTRYIKELLHDFVYKSNTDGRSMDELVGILYDKDRLYSRLNLFKCFPLASMANLASHNSYLRYKVFYSTLLPADIVFDLKQTLKPHNSWCECIGVDPLDSFFNVCRRSIHQYIDCPVFTFRLDDDDALGSHYIEHIDNTIGLNSGKAIFSIPSGYTLSRVGIDDFILLQKDQFKIALGLGRLDNPSRASTIFDEEHLHGLIPDYQVYRISTEPMWIRTVHDSNDSIPELPNSTTLTGDEVIEELSNSFSPFIDRHILMNLPLLDKSPDQSRRKVLFGHQ